jgi:hypothetical protein
MIIATSNSINEKPVSGVTGFDLAEIIVSLRADSSRSSGIGVGR